MVMQNVFLFRQIKIISINREKKMDTLPDDVLLKIYFYKHNLLYKEVMIQLFWRVVAIEEWRESKQHCDYDD